MKRKSSQELLNSDLQTEEISLPKPGLYYESAVKKKSKWAMQRMRHNTNTKINHKYNIPVDDVNRRNKSLGQIVAQRVSKAGLDALERRLISANP